MHQMHQRRFQIAWLACVLITVGLACNFITGLSEDIEGARGTAEAAASEVRALASQAQGLATSVEESGYLKTAQALATKEGGVVLATAQALATEAEEYGVLETAQAFVTEEGGNLLATARVIATQGVQTGSAPSDIPIVDEDTIVNFFGSESIVTYMTSLGFQKVVDFYKQEMPTNGWEATTQGNVETDKFAHLKFTKLNQTANISININPLDQKTLVTVWIQE